MRMDARVLVIPSFLVTICLAGCPEKAPGPDVQDVRGASGEKRGSNAGPADGGQVPPTAGSPGGGPVGASAPPGFASLIKDGKTITIKGVITNATRAQVDFTLAKKDHDRVTPSVVEVIKTTDGTFSVTAPASYPDPFYVSAMVDAKGDGPTPDDEGTMLPEPIVLAGKDIDLTLEIGANKDWETKVPWTRPSGSAAGGQGTPGGKR
jgi:hypothetical protein